jgi:hypothetical protein
MSCPGSVVLSEGMPNKSSPHSELGTRAHALAEAILATGATPPDPDGMLPHVMVYVDHVRSLGGELHIEQRVHVTQDVYGTADAVVWQAEARHLHICDYKNGAGVPVEIHGNLQLRIYALAALLTFKYPATQVTATIVQPRCPHADGPVRSVTFDVVDLIDFHADLLDAVDRVHTAQTLHPGNDHPIWVRDHLAPTEKGCRWCLASPKCPALKSKAQQLARQVFAPGVAYDPLELARTLDFLPILEGWIKNTREFAYAEAEKGHDIPDYKLVEKRATAKWKDGVAEQLAKALGVKLDELYDDVPRPLKGITEIVKLASGKNDKERKAVIDPFVSRESSGHTLVHTSDKRPAVKVDAASAFATS